MRDLPHSAGEKSGCGESCVIAALVRKVSALPPRNVMSAVCGFHNTFIRLWTFPPIACVLRAYLGRMLDLSHACSAAAHVLGFHSSDPV